MMKKILSILLVLMLLSVCSLAEEWACPSCGSTDNTGNFCGDCGAEKPSETWVCSQCGEENQKEFCTNCGAAKNEQNATTTSYAVGDIVTFGTYAGEPIEWRVLEVKEDGTYVLLSEYGLEAKAYDDEEVDVTWETCSLREWLNGEFYETVFTDEERAKIQLTDVENANNPTYGTEGGNDTQDYVYLLSLDEVQKYFTLEDVEDEWILGRSEDVICMPTQHAVDNGAVTMSADGVEKYQSDYSYELREGACWWWLRSPGHCSGYAALVDYDGFVHSGGYYVYDDVCVRPVVVVRLS